MSNINPELVEKFTAMAQAVAATVAEVPSKEEAFKYVVDLCLSKDPCELLADEPGTEKGPLGPNRVPTRVQRVLAAPSLNDEDFALLDKLCQEKGILCLRDKVRQYAADNNIPLYGSYDPECVDGLVELDFFDGLHCSGSGIEKFFPGVPQTLQDLENGTLPDPLAVHPRTSLETPGEETPEGENADASAETADSTTTEEA